MLCPLDGVEAHRLISTQVILSLVSGDLTDRQYYALHERGVRAAVSGEKCSQDLLDLLSMLLDKDVEARTSAAGALNESRWLVAPGSTSVDTSVTYPIQPCKGVQLCLDEYIDWMNCVYSDICEEELTCEDEGMADDRCEGMLIWCDSANACTFPTSGAGGCPEFGSQFDNDDSAGGGDDHSGHDHDEGHSSDGAISTTPAVLVAALAALAYA